VSITLPLISLAPPLHDNVVVYGIQKMVPSGASCRDDASTEGDALTGKNVTSSAIRRWTFQLAG
jgi:hypothetical protein